MDRNSIPNPSPISRGREQVRRALVRALALTVLLLIVGATPAFAYQQVTGTDVIIPASQTIDDDVVATGTSVTVAGHITGDLYALAQTVTLTSTARVDGDVIAAAQTVVIAGKVGNSVIIGGQYVQVPAGSNIGGGLALAGQSATIDGTVGRGLAAAAQVLSLSGQVGKEARVSATTLTFLPTAKVAGDLTYASAAPATIPPGVIAGTVHYIPPPPPQPKPAEPAFSGPSVFGIIWFLGNLAVGLLLVLCFPRMRDATCAEIVERPVQTAGIGLLALVAAPLVVIVLLITVLGIPLALVGMGGYVAFLYGGWWMMCYALGVWLLQLLARRSTWQAPASLVIVLPFVLGVVVVTILRVIPYVNTLTAIAGVCFGLGSLVIAVYHVIQGGRQRIAPPAPSAPAAPLTPQAS